MKSNRGGRGKFQSSREGQERRGPSDRPAPKGDRRSGPRRDDRGERGASDNRGSSNPREARNDRPRPSRDDRGRSENAPRGRDDRETRGPGKPRGERTGAPDYRGSRPSRPSGKPRGERTGGRDARGGDEKRPFRGEEKRPFNRDRRPSGPRSDSPRERSDGAAPEKRRFDNRGGKRSRDDSSGSWSKEGRPQGRGRGDSRRPDRFRSERPDRRDSRRDDSRPATVRPQEELTRPPERSLIFGRRPVGEIIRHAPERLKRIWIGADTGAKEELDRQTGGIPTRLKIETIERSALDRLASGGNHQGVVAELTEFQFTTLERIIGRASKTGGAGIIVVADEITDPQNLGALLRVCEGTGVLGVILPERRSAPVTATVRKTSAGASELVPICEVTNLQRALLTLKENGFWVVGTVCTEGSTSLYSAELPKRAVVIFGSEGKGVRALSQKECDYLVHLPMCGLIDSLNVSTAAAAVLFEFVRRGITVPSTEIATAGDEA